MISSNESISDPKEFKTRLNRLCRKMDYHIQTLEEGNGQMASVYSSYLSSDKQVQEELILILSHKHHSDDNEEPEDRPTAAEIAEILIQLSKEDENSTNEDDEQRFGRLFQISDSDISIARDEVDKTVFFNLVAQELDRGNRRLGTMVKSFENVRAAQYRLVKEKLQEMRWDLGEPELSNIVAENDMIISSLREQLAAETERENLQRMQPDYAAEKEEIVLSLSKSSEMTKQRAAQLETEVGRLGGDLERCRAQIAQVLQEIVEDELQEKQLQLDLMNEEISVTTSEEIKAPPTAISRTTSSSKSMSRAKARALAQAQSPSHSSWREDEEIDIPVVIEVDGNAEELLQRVHKAQQATQRMKRRKETLKDELKVLQERIQQQNNELKILKGAGEKEKDSDKASVVKLHLTRMQKKVAIMEARIKSQTSRLEELQQQERRRQQSDAAANIESSSQVQGMTLWQPPDLAVPDTGNASSAQGFPSRKLVHHPNKSHRADAAPTQPAKREMRSIDEAFVHIMAPTEQTDGSTSSATHPDSATLVIAESSDAKAGKNGPGEVVTEKLQKVSKSLKSVHKVAPSDLNAITLTRKGVEQRKELDSAVDTIAAEGDPSKTVDDTLSQDFHVNEMAVIIDRFHEHSRRFVQHSAEGLDVLFPPIPVSSRKVAEVKAPAKIVVGGQSKSNNPSAETKEATGPLKVADSNLMPDQPAPSPRKNKVSVPVQAAGAGAVSVQPTNMSLPLPSAIQGRSSPFSVSVSIPLSVPRPQTIKVSEVGTEAIDRLLAQEDDTEVLNQNFGLKAAVEQMHTLLAELSALSPTAAKAKVQEDAKQMEKIRKQRKLCPAVEISVPVFDDEDLLEEESKQQSQSANDEADAKRELDMERAMGSVEYLRVRINQQLQMLRHVYRDTNSEKMAIKYAKQKVINERLATQNERSKLLIAIDHNKYYWPPDSQPGELQIQIQRSQQNISRLRTQVKQHDKSVKILDDARIRAALETIEYLISKDAKVILCSHFGRPKGCPVDELSLAIVATRLSELLGGRRVVFTHDCIGADVDRAKDSMTDRSVLLLENLRFHPEEEMNDQDFGRQLMKGVDVYVNDAFGSSHRAHASIVAAAKLSPLSCEGFLMRKELRFLGDTFQSPHRPLAAVVGGAKVSTKVKVLRRLLSVVDKLILGGAMVYTFYKAMGFSVGDSLVEDSCLQEADSILRDAEKRGIRLLLSCDSRIVPTGLGQKISVEADSQMHTVSNEHIPDGWMGVDIGELSLHQLKAELQDCKTIIWNGPMGKAEKPEYAHGSWELARYLSDLTASSKEVVSVICGGDTVAVVDGMGSDQGRAALCFSHVSSGGGAALEFLQGDVLPGISVLPDR